MALSCRLRQITCTPRATPPGGILMRTPGPLRPPGPLRLAHGPPPSVSYPGIPPPIRSPGLSVGNSYSPQLPSVVEVLLAAAVWHENPRTYCLPWTRHGLGHHKPGESGAEVTVIRVMSEPAAKLTS